VIGSGGVEAIRRQRPEWTPWLAVVDEALREAKDARWEAAVPDAWTVHARPCVPLLSGATVVIDGKAVRRLFRRLVDIASRAGTPKMATLERCAREEIDAAGLFRASICQDSQAVARLASGAGADTEALQGVAALVSMPWLQACRRRLAPAVPIDWIEGYCPICGAWPAFAEMRGIERRRQVRCGRCGGEWHARLLHCAYCGNAVHDDLVTFLPQTTAPAGAIDACRRCHGYVKVFTTLQGCPPAGVLLQDLNSVDLDVAALEQGYRRPPGPGCAIDIAVDAVTSTRRFFVWNA